MKLKPMKPSHHPCLQPGKEIPLCALEEFIKNEIVVTKVCSCPNCNFRRKMFRRMQYLINEYKTLKNK